MRNPLARLVIIIIGTVISVSATRAAHDVMPAPAELRMIGGKLAITREFAVGIDGHSDARLQDGIARALRRWEARTGFTFARPFGAAGAHGTLIIGCSGPGNVVPVLGEDESYTLEVTPTGAVMRAPAVVGALRGLETLLQLLASDANSFYVPAVVVRDAPRFPWRGLLVDVARHWQPMPVIKRTLDGMALAKLNVLHLHATEDQGFRIESKRFPKLHELGSDGDYFTQDEIREIVAYAAARGIRVVPEFDIPGHATSWLVGYPELASGPGPYVIERKWGIFDPTLDPTNEKTYELLDGFLGEMAALFPDPYLHIGGDENNGKQWDANPKIQAFMRERGLKDNHALQAHFNRRVLAILTKYKKRMVGWDEIFHPDLPKDAVIHSWRGPESLADAASQGFQGILSNGYYIDLSHPARDHYLNDPLPADTKLTPEQQKRVLGGEATMWAEWATPETIDSRIWPRTAAIAERLWSPQNVRDLDDMHRRLAIVSQRLEELDLSLTRHVDFMLRRFAGEAVTAGDLTALRRLADLVEPVKFYHRGQMQPETTQFTPLTGFVDCTRPDSAPSREFATVIDRVVKNERAADIDAAEDLLHGWLLAAETVDARLTAHSPRVRALRPLLGRVIAACGIGLEACTKLAANPASNEAWCLEKLAALDAAATPHDACELPIIPALRLLVAATSAQSERATMSPAEWRTHLEALLAPPPPAAHPEPAAAH